MDCLNEPSEAIKSLITIELLIFCNRLAAYCQVFVCSVIKHDPSGGVDRFENAKQGQATTIN